MVLMNSPCIEKKCILYPICQNRVYINCDDLLKYFHYLQSIMYHTEIWEMLNTGLPKLCQVRSNKGDFYL